MSRSHVLHQTKTPHEKRPVSNVPPQMMNPFFDDDENKICETAGWHWAAVREVNCKLKCCE
jgi:hypothetical protein